MDDVLARVIDDYTIEFAVPQEIQNIGRLDELKTISVIPTPLDNFKRFY